MTKESDCPLCKRSANELPLIKYEGQRVSCQTCGNYDILGIDVNIGIEEYAEAHGVEVKEIAFKLSGLTRQASDAGNRIVIDNELSDLLESVAIPKTYPEKMDRALIYISEHQSRADQHIQVVFEDDYPLVFAKDGNEFRYFLDTSVSRGLLERRGAHLNRALTTAAWSVAPCGQELA